METGKRIAAQEELGSLPRGQGFTTDTSRTSHFEHPGRPKARFAAGGGHPPF